MIKKAMVLAASVAVMVCAGSAHATEYSFDLTGFPGRADFQIDDANHPIYVAATAPYFEYQNVSGYFFAVGSQTDPNSTIQWQADLRFYATINAGGIEADQDQNGRNEQIFSLEGAQLYSGIDSATFKIDPENYTFTRDEYAGTVSENLDITEVSAAPEPSTWALMFTGVGTLGLMLRRRRSMGPLTAA